MNKFLAVRILIVSWAVHWVWKRVRDRKYLIKFLAFPVSSLRAVLIKWCQKWWHLWGINVLIAGFGFCLISFPPSSLLCNLLMVSLAGFGPLSYWAKSDWGRKSRQPSLPRGLQIESCWQAHLMCQSQNKAQKPVQLHHFWASSSSLPLSLGLAQASASHSCHRKICENSGGSEIFSLVYSCCGSIVVIWYTQWQTVLLITSHV